MTKKIISFLTILLFTFTIGLNVAVAAGSATEILTVSSSNINNGNEITVTVSVNNISGVGGGKIMNYQGTLNWDTSFFDYVTTPSPDGSFTLTGPIPIVFNSANGIFGGTATSASQYITSSSSGIFTIKLKAKKEGTTQISISNGKMGDAYVDKVNLTASTAKTITIGSTPLQSSNNFLGSLSVSGYDDKITPAFDKNVTSYSLEVPNNADSIIINATKEDSKASISGTGTKNNLKVGQNTFPIVVTAENGSQKTYTIIVNRKSGTTIETPASNDATLKSISISGYTLSPKFNSNTTSYSITVPESIKGLDVTALANNAKATVSVTGNTGWTSGTNTINVKVTAEDGSVRYYNINVLRPLNPATPAKSSNNYLSDLAVKNYPISFNKDTTDYFLEVPYEMDKIDISTITEDSKSTVQIMGNENFKVGEVNVVVVKVTAEDGSIRTYTLNVKRSAITSKNKLEELEIEGEELKPGFDPDIDEYELTVKNSVKDLEIAYKSQDPDAKVTVTGNKDLKVGNNLVRIKVTDANGFERTYFVNVNREPLKILGLNPYIFLGLLGLLFLGFIIFLLLKKKKEEPEEENETNQTININVNPNFSPDVSVGSKNNSDFAQDNAKVIRESEISDDNVKPKILDYEENKALEYKEAVYTEKSENDDESMTRVYNLDDLQHNKIKDDSDLELTTKFAIDELIEALKNGDKEKLFMFKRQVEADELKDVLRGFDPDRDIDYFDDNVSVREVVKAIEQYQKTGDKKLLKMLIGQYDVNKAKRKISKRDRTNK